jgi:hypothetical protein
MVVESPPCQWPSVLQECGPEQDPSILLVGAARIGETAVQVVAIRINATLRWSPDYRPGVAEDTYRSNGLDEALEAALEGFQSGAAELEEFLGNSGSSVVELASGTYRMWVIPGPSDP